MTWEINIPYRDRDDPISEIGFAASELPEDERAVVRRLTLDAITSGTETCGEFLDQLEDLGVAGRRQLLDRTREEVGLEPTAVLDQRREQRRIDARFSDADIPPPPRWEGEWQQCHAPNCNAFPASEAGVPTKVSCERWFCPEHEGLAQPRDLEDHESPYVGLEFGRLIPSEREKARIAAEIRKRDEPREREQALQEEAARRRAEVLDAVQERYENEAMVSVGGVKMPMRNVRINP